MAPTASSSTASLSLAEARAASALYDERYGPLVFLRVDPDLDGVRNDPRFDALVARIRPTPAT